MTINTCSLQEHWQVFSPPTHHEQRGGGLFVPMTWTLVLPTCVENLVWYIKYISCNRIYFSNGDRIGVLHVSDGIDLDIWLILNRFYSHIQGGEGKWEIKKKKFWYRYSGKTTCHTPTSPCYTTLHPLVHTIPFTSYRQIIARISLEMLCHVMGNMRAQPEECLCRDGGHVEDVIFKK